jgi:hypothetical protein
MNDFLKWIYSEHLPHEQALRGGIKIKPAPWASKKAKLALGAGAIGAAGAGGLFGGGEDDEQKMAGGGPVEKFSHIAELGGLGMLSLPSIQKLRGKKMDEKKAAALDLAGLGLLAAPSALGLSGNALSRVRGRLKMAKGGDVDGAHDYAKRRAMWGAAGGTLAGLFTGAGVDVGSGLGKSLAKGDPKKKLALLGKALAEERSILTKPLLRRALRGGAAGAATGAGAGGLSGYLSGRRDYDERNFANGGEARKAAGKRGAAYGALSGAVHGGILGGLGAPALMALARPGEAASMRTAALRGALLGTGIGTGLGALHGYSAGQNLHHIVMGDEPQYQGKKVPLSVAERTGGFETGGPVPGQPEYDHNTVKNDKVPAMLTPQEIVLPLSVTKSQNPSEAAKHFVANIMKKKGVQHFDDGGYVKPDAASSNKQLMLDKWGPEAAEKFYPGVALPQPKPPAPQTTVDDTPIPELGQSVNELRASNPQPAGPQTIPAHKPFGMEPQTLPSHEPAFQPPAPPAQTQRVDVSNLTSGARPQEPDLMAGARQGMTEIDAAAEAQKQANLDAAKAESDRTAQAAKVYDDEQQHLNDLAATHQKTMGDLQKRTADLETWLSDPKNGIDANRLWSQSRSGAKVSASLGIILGGIGQGLLRGGPNQALEMVNRQIDRDIEAQHGNIRLKTALLGQTSIDANRAQMEYDSAKLDRLSLVRNQLASIDAKSTDPAVKARAAGLNAEIQKQQGQLHYDIGIKNMQLGVQTQATSGDGIPAAWIPVLPENQKGLLVPAPTSNPNQPPRFLLANSEGGKKAIDEFETTARPLNDTLNKIDALREKAIRMKVPIWNIAPRETLDALQSACRLNAQAYFEAGKLSPQTQELYDALVSDPSSVFDLFLNQSNRSDVLRGDIATKRQVLYRSHVPAYQGPVQTSPWQR